MAWVVWALSFSIFCHRGVDSKHMILKRKMKIKQCNWPTAVYHTNSFTCIQTLTHLPLSSVPPPHKHRWGGKPLSHRRTGESDYSGVALSHSLRSPSATHTHTYILWRTYFTYFHQFICQAGKLSTSGLTINSSEPKSDTKTYTYIFQFVS